MKFKILIIEKRTILHNGIANLLKEHIKEVQLEIIWDALEIIPGVVQKPDLILCRAYGVSDRDK